MTTPIDPGNTEALAKIAYDQLTHYGNVPFDQRISGSVEKYRKIADAVARAVCPVGYSVIADDDLRVLWIAALMHREDHMGLGDPGNEIDARLDAVIDRWRHVGEALIGDE